MPPIESRAAATWVSAWVSTPPVTARVSTMVNVIPFLGLRDGTHRWAVGSGNPGLLHRSGRSDRHNRWCHNLGPADTTALTTARPASAESDVRPGPRPPTLRAHRAEARQAEPDALATPSLPTMRGRPGRDQPERVDLLCGSHAAFAARRSSRKRIVRRTA